MKSINNRIRVSMTALAGIILMATSCQEPLDIGDAVYMTGTASTPLVQFAIDGFPSSYNLSVTATDKVKQTTSVALEADLSLVEEYNQKMGVSYYPLPESSFELSDTHVTIKEGKSVSEAIKLTITNDVDFVSGRVYLVPVTIKEVDGGEISVLEPCRTIYLKVSRTLYFYAPYVGDGNMSYQFLFSNPVTSLPTYTYEVKIYATQFRSTSASTPTRVCSFGGNASSIEGGSIPDEGFKCDQNLLRFGEGTDAPNILHITTKQGKMSANNGFQLNRWYAVALVNDGQTLTLYVDGEKDNSMTVLPYEYTLYGVQIGMPSTGYQSSQLFYGRLSEMRLWDRPLSARELKANVCGVDPETSGLVSYWRMNEGTAKTFYDSSPSKRDIGYTTNITINWTITGNTCVE